MSSRVRILCRYGIVLPLVVALSTHGYRRFLETPRDPTVVSSRTAFAWDRSAPLSQILSSQDFATTSDSDVEKSELGMGATLAPEGSGSQLPPDVPHSMPAYVAPPIPDEAIAVEQRAIGTKPAARLVASFDGLGAGFEGPQGKFTGKNPSDNSLAVGPDHIVQVVNTSVAIFTKQGRRFATTGEVLYGPVPTNTIYGGFGGPCERRNNGDAVVRYDQLADRWLFVMPIFVRGPLRQEQPPPGRADNDNAVATTRGRGDPLTSGARPFPSEIGEPSRTELEGVRAQPGAMDPLVRNRTEDQDADSTPEGVYSMCYAVSTSPDPLGAYYRYEFLRPLFPDYPRPAVWPDGYYMPTSTGDDVIEKHACVVDRLRMLRGEAATEQCIVLKGVNFLNNADLDGSSLPPPGAPNIVLATGGSQLLGAMEDDGIYAWKFHVDWLDPSKTRLEGPTKIPVAPYHYLCDGQLTDCVPQPGTVRRLDAQGDKIMARVTYRSLGIGGMVVALHSVNTSSGGGGVRWYEFRVDGSGELTLFQQGTYAPDGSYRWMASPATDRNGNIGVGFSFGDSTHFVGQRFAARHFGDPPGQLTLRETILVEGKASQSETARWEDYTQTAVDPSDDCTLWYVGDYLKEGESRYTTRVGAFEIANCHSS